MQTQQVNTLKMSEKQLKQENNHLQEIKLSLEKQNNELRKYAELLFIFDSWSWFVIVLEGESWEQYKFQKLAAQKVLFYRVKLSNVACPWLRFVLLIQLCIDLY